MKKSGMARPELLHQLVHTGFESLRVLDRYNPASALLGELGPSSPVEVRIKVLALDLCRRSIEHLCALFQ